MWKRCSPGTVCNNYYISLPFAERYVKILLQSVPRMATLCNKKIFVTYRASSVHTYCVTSRKWSNCCLQIGKTRKTVAQAQPPMDNNLTVSPESHIMSVLLHILLYRFTSILQLKLILQLCNNKTSKALIFSDPNFVALIDITITS
jgi:hypothetical protein